MDRLRALIFNVAFYVTTALFLMFGAPLLLAPRRIAVRGLRLHARVIHGLLELIVGARVTVSGRDNLPPEPSLIVAKHQSTWDTIYLNLVFRDPAFVLKSELLGLPLYGTFIRKFEMIPIARDQGPAALRTMMDAADRALKDGRDIIIFPEGTRRPPGAPPAYKPGFVRLAQALVCPVVPVAINSGHVWPNQFWIRNPGRIHVEILPPISGERRRETLLPAVRDAIEDRLKERV